MLPSKAAQNTKSKRSHINQGDTPDYHLRKENRAAAAKRRGPAKDAGASGRSMEARLKQAGRWAFHLLGED